MGWGSGAGGWLSKIRGTRRWGDALWEARLALPEGHGEPSALRAGGREHPMAESQGWVHLETERAAGGRGILGEQMKVGGSIWGEAQQTQGERGALGLKCEAPKTEGREGCCCGERGEDR